MQLNETNSRAKNNGRPCSQKKSFLAVLLQKSISQRWRWKNCNRLSQHWKDCWRTWATQSSKSISLQIFLARSTEKGLSTIWKTRQILLSKGFEFTEARGTILGNTANVGEHVCTWIQTTDNKYMTRIRL